MLGVPTQRSAQTVLTTLGSMRGWFQQRLAGNPEFYRLASMAATRAGSSGVVIGE